MITAKIACKTALKYVAEIFPDLSNVEVEEIDMSLDRRNWFVTVSMPSTTSVNKTIPPLNKYKVVNISNKTGLVEWMKMKIVK